MGCCRVHSLAITIKVTHTQSLRFPRYVSISPSEPNSPTANAISSPALRLPSLWKLCSLRSEKPQANRTKLLRNIDQTDGATHVSGVATSKCQHAKTHGSGIRSPDSKAAVCRRGESGEERPLLLPRISRYRSTSLSHATSSRTKSERPRRRPRRSEV